MNVPPLIIFDLDGTLADNTHRQHLVEGKKKDFRSFDLSCYCDVPMHATIAVAKALHAAGHELWLFSGRSGEVSVLTQTWLIEHGINHLFTLQRYRPVRDAISDVEMKKSWYVGMAQEDKDRLLLVFDNRDRLVKMWRELGVTCFQVASGDF